MSQPNTMEVEAAAEDSEHKKNGIRMEDAILLSKQLSLLVNDEKTSDITFLLGAQREKVFAHKVILAARSPVFAAMLFGMLRESREQEIAVPNIEAGVFLSMLEYVYTGKTKITTDTAVELLAASNQYDVSYLAKKCGEHISRALCSTNVCSILVRTQGFPDIFKMCTEFIEANASAAFNSKGFLELPEETVIDLVQRDHLGIQEIELFNAVLRWGKHNCAYSAGSAGVNANNEELNDETKKLRYAVRNIVKHVRLPLISPTDLLKIVKPSNIVPVESYLLAIEYLAAPDQVDTSNNKFFRRRLGFGPLFGFSWKPADGFNVLGTEGATAIRTGDDSWRGIFGNRGIYLNGSKQNIRFEIEIIRINSDRSGMVIGVAKLNDRYSCCWGYGGSGYSYPSQTRAVVQQCEFQVNDIIGIHLDNAMRQVSFYRNGSLLFDKAKPLPLGIEVYPVVYMHYVHDEVCIRHVP